MTRLLSYVLTLLLRENFERLQWSFPSLDEEAEEIARASKELEVSFDVLLHAFQNGVVVKLNDQAWQRLRNTDSWETNSLQDVKNLSKQYGRDFQRIADAMLQKKTLPAPLVVMTPNKQLFLVAGNTRLMTARALKVQPFVLLAKLT